MTFNALPNISDVKYSTFMTILSNESGGVENVFVNSSLRTIDEPPINYFYTSMEIIVAVMAVFGNALVITVFCKERRLRRRTNYYIVSLAAADLLVGLLGVPFAIMSDMGLPRELHACLFTVSLLIVLCTTSIFCLVAVSVDRYWAILYPMGYSRNVRTKTALDEGHILLHRNLGLSDGYEPRQVCRLLPDIPKKLLNRPFKNITLKIPSNKN